MTDIRAFEAVLLDMDGVVVDTQETVTRFWRDVATSHSIALTADDFRRHVYGVPASRTLDVLFPSLDRPARENVLDLMYTVEAAGPYQQIPGAKDLLRALRDHAIPTALVTSAEPLKVETVLAALRVAGLFTTIVTRGDIMRGKPDPESYLLAATRLGMDPARCLVLEDALSGIEAGIAAGCTCIGVTSPEFADELLGAGAAVIVTDLRSITLDCSDRHRVLRAGSRTFKLPAMRDESCSLPKAQIAVDNQHR